MERKFAIGDKVVPNYTVPASWQVGVVIGYDPEADYPRVCYRTNGSISFDREESLRPAPRSIESIVQEGVEDFTNHMMELTWSGKEKYNFLAAIIEAAILADREERE